MKTKKTYFALTLMLCIASASAQQYYLLRTATGTGGGGQSSSTGYTMGNTVGEQGNGSGSSSSYGSRGGFWSPYAFAPLTIAVSVTSGWNMIANPVTVTNDSVRVLFPTSVTPYAYEFNGGYTQRYTLANGKGYWAKFPGALSQPVIGVERLLDSISVSVGWNMVGTISSTVDTGTIVSVPSGLRGSSWFGYAGGYSASVQLLPGHGYWIKANSAGKFVMAASMLARPAKVPATSRTVNDVLNSITITDTKGRSQTLYFGADVQKEIPVALYDMPPTPPVGGFDARFSTSEGGSMVRTHAEKSLGEFPVTIQSDAYPLTVTWNVSRGTASYELSFGQSAGKRTSREMSGEGSLKITSEDINKLTVRMTGDSELPKEFALSQNYPNPFNPSTTVKYNLPIDSRVSLKLFNVVGQEVATLVNEEQKAGYKSIQWNAANLASGVYFYQIQAGSFTSVKKLLLLK